MFGKKKQLVFLGGTCGNNDWRLGLIDRLVQRGIDQSSLFNPVTPDWNAEAQAREDKAKKEATVNLFYLGDPQEADNRFSAYSLLEARDALQDQPNRTVVVFDPTGMPKHAVKVCDKAYKDLKARFPRAPIFATLAEAEEWLFQKLK